MDENTTDASGNDTCPECGKDCSACGWIDNGCCDDEYCVRCDEHPNNCDCDNYEPKA